MLLCTPPPRMASCLMKFVMKLKAPSASQASFLAPSERAWLVKRQEAAAGEAARSGAGTVSLAAVKDIRTWHLSAISLLANIPKWGIVFFCPLIIDYILGERSHPRPCTPLLQPLSRSSHTDGVHGCARPKHLVR